jgi:pyruvate ferredoxin oxidoreductase gamma subunit
VVRSGFLLKQFRLHGRGGQGAVLGAELLARAAFLEGKWSQAFPFFGAERRGAPVKAFTRISDREILSRSQIYDPDYVILLDSKLLGVVDVFEGLKKDGMVIANYGRKPSELGLKFRVAVVNATDIALKLGALVAGIPVVNTAMLGTVARATHEVSMESVKKAIMQEWPGRAGELNVACAMDAYRNTVFEEHVSHYG